MQSKKINLVNNLNQEMQDLNHSELQNIFGGVTPKPSGVLQWIGYYAHATWNCLTADAPSAYPTTAYCN